MRRKGASAERLGKRTAENEGEGRMGNEHLARLAAARAVAFYVDHDNAIMFPEAGA